MIIFRKLVTAIAILVTAGCSPQDRAPSDDGEQDGKRHPDVVDVVTHKAGQSFTFEVTISSPYDSPRRYADGWRIKGRDGIVFAEHTLAHDHAGEQPFTRTQSDVLIPNDVSEVIVEARDQRYGYGGKTMTVRLP